MPTLRQLLLTDEQKSLLDVDINTEVINLTVKDLHYIGLLFMQNAPRGSVATGNMVSVPGYAINKLLQRAYILDLPIFT